jgi:hypothetical protein
MNKKIIKLLPMLIIVAAATWLLVKVAFTETSLMNKHIVGLVLLAVTITTQLFNEKYGYWVTGLLLTIGTFSFATFTPSVYSFHLGRLSFDLLCLPTLVLFLFIHRNEILYWVREIKDL